MSAAAHACWLSDPKLALGQMLWISGSGRHYYPVALAGFETTADSYEAWVDGATGLQSFWYITLPLETHHGCGCLFRTIDACGH